MNMVPDYRSEDGSTEIQHLDGVPWWEAPLPPRDHKCWTQTNGWIGFNQVQRCACGATYFNTGGWWEVNSRRQDITQVKPRKGLRERLRGLILDS